MIFYNYIVFNLVIIHFYIICNSYWLCILLHFRCFACFIWIFVCIHGDRQSDRQTNDSQTDIQSDSLTNRQTRLDPRSPVSTWASQGMNFLTYISCLIQLIFFSTGFAEATKLARKLSALFESGQRLFDDCNYRTAKDSETSKFLGFACKSETYFQSFVARFKSEVWKKYR